MKRTYLAPEAEPISIASTIIAASLQRSANSTDNIINCAGAVKDNEWGSIWK